MPSDVILEITLQAGNTLLQAKRLSALAGTKAEQPRTPGLVKKTGHLRDVSSYWVNRNFKGCIRACV